MRTKLGLSLMLAAVLGLPSASSATWPDMPTQGNGTVQAIACATSAADPGDCTSVTVVNTAAQMDTCAQLSGDHVCYVNHLLTVTDPSDTAAFDWIIDATAQIDLAVVCAPGAGFVLNQTDASVTKSIVEGNLVAAAANDNMRFTVSGCTIYQTVNGVPGGGSGSPEGLVFKTSGSTTTRQRLIFEKNRVFVYSTGGSTMGIGTVPTSKADMVIDSNTIFAAIGVDLKNQCAGCDDTTHVVSNNRIFANPAGVTPRCAKVDEDANVLWVNNYCSAGLIGFDSDAATDGGDFTFVGSNNIFADMGTVPRILSFGGTLGHAYTFHSVTGSFIVEDGPGAAASDLIQIGQSGVSKMDLDVTFERCPILTVSPYTAMTEYLDIRNIDDAANLDYIRLNVKLPQGCTVPTTAQIVGGSAASETGEVDVQNTVGIVKVSNSVTATVSLFDGSSTFNEFTLADDSVAGLAEVSCGGRIATATSVSDAWDTGVEQAAYCGYECIDVNLAAGTDDDCTSDNTAAGDVIVQMR